jgi:sporulation protein YlmC with PRC-barrel domain
MPNILAENLSGKAVRGDDGSELGDLYNITMDLKSGAIKDLLVTPTEDSVRPGALEFEQDENDRLHIPVDRVYAVRDYILVQR